MNRITPFPSRLPARATRTGCFRGYGLSVPVLVCLLLATAARSETIYDLLAPPPEHRLWLEYNRGLEDSQSFYGELDLAIANGNRLLLGAGQSDIQGLTRRVDLYSYTAGLSTPYGEPFEAGMRYEFWGNTSELWTHTLSVPLAWNTPDWFLGLRPAYTRIYAYLRRFGTPIRQVETASQFVTGHLGYDGLPRWSFSLYGAIHHYDTDLSRFRNPLARYLFSDVTLVLGYGFPRRRLGAEMEYDFDAWRIGAGYEQTVSEVDASRLDVTTLKTAFRLHDRLTLHAQGGHVTSETGPAYNFLQLASQVLF